MALSAPSIRDLRNECSNASSVCPFPGGLGGNYTLTISVLFYVNRDHDATNFKGVVEKKKDHDCLEPCMEYKVKGSARAKLGRTRTSG